MCGLIYSLIYSLTYICSLPLLLALLFSSGDNSEWPGSLQRAGGGKKKNERGKESEREKKKLRRSKGYDDSVYDNYLGLNCRCEVRGMAVKTGQVERGKPVNSPLTFCIFSRAALTHFTENISLLSLPPHRIV